MSSLYAQYIAEREGSGIIENEDGFLVYEIGNGWLFIKDIFVTKEKRNSKLASKMADEAVSKAIEQGVTMMFSHVDIRALNWQESVKFIEKYGCEPVKLENNLLYFQKKIG